MIFICLGIKLLVIHISLKYLDQLTPINCFFSFSKRLNSFLKTAFSLLSKFPKDFMVIKQTTIRTSFLFPEQSSASK